MFRKLMLRRFAKDERAAVGIMFGLTLVPMVGFVGAALDYSRASLVRLDLQSAADVTALSLAKDAVRMTPAEVNQRATELFNNNWSGRYGTTVTQLEVVRGADRFTVTARAQIANTISQVIGAPTTRVDVTSTSAWSVNRIEIALVLDNTGSMGWSNKMEELKRALCGDTTCSNTNPTAGFVRQMSDAAREDDQIRISLVPFDTTVRVPRAVQDAVNAGTEVNSVFAGSGAGYCGSNNTQAQLVNWSLTGPNTLSWFRFANRDKDTNAGRHDNNGNNVGFGCGTGRTNRANWQGCIWDRDQSGNRDTIPTGVAPGNIETLYPAVNCRSNSLARMMPLVDVRTNTANLILAMRAMQPSGNTNVTIGMTWGHNMLLPGAPMSTAATPTTERPIQRFLILLTDGENTENRTSPDDIDARTRLACDAAKAIDITVYTIRVIEGNRNLLRDCASAPANYYEVSSAAQLAPVFQSIAGQIGAIRLTN